MRLSTDITLDDKYAQTSGRVFISGTQALVRLPLMQRARDLAAGLNTAGYVTGYRGSPLGGYDQQLKAAATHLSAMHVRFEPGVNEDLAATAVWGTQQVQLVPGADYDGVFAIWYGKGPGVDRSGDPIKHGNRTGTAPHGGVLVVFGDDHPGKSSTISHQSEQALAANGLPVLYPADVQEVLDFGLHGFALSRYAGVWVGFKCVNETVEANATVEVGPDRAAPRIPDGELPSGGVHARFGFDPIGDEIRLVRHKLPRAQAYARLNGLDRVTHGASAIGGLGIVTAGKSWLDVMSALAMLGLDDARCSALGVSVYKPGLIWPLEPQGLRAFAVGRSELLIVEEKSAFLEPQVAHVLFNVAAHERPRLFGKFDDAAASLLPADVVLEPVDIARVIGGRLGVLGLVDEALQTRIAELTLEVDAARARQPGPGARSPYFCSGCPHNTSTKVPEGSVAFAGIGCHTMALFMDRSTLPPTHMGGEGMNWVGIAPFTRQTHAFQNIGDGTYFHSGLMAIRAAVAAGTNITYKILYNDAVAMTGGQQVEGHLSVAEITHQLRAERIDRIAVVSDDIEKYGATPGFAARVTIHHRSELDAVQKALREVPGASVLIYDQVCAAEKRRRRKRGKLVEPSRRVLINPLVCEGCGDCSVASNCVSVEPLETEFGRKRTIDQSSCNKDYSCLQGFCPSFVTVEGGQLAKPATASLDADMAAGLPEPAIAPIDRALNLLVTGIGGTGVVTVGSVLGMAAHLEGLCVSVYDMTGLAQKGGGVLSHVKIAAAHGALAAPRVGVLEADVVLGCDLVVSASAEVLRCLDVAQTHVVLNTHLVPTAAFQSNPDIDFHESAMVDCIKTAVGADRVHCVEATATARRLLGDTIGANLFMVGFALQKGWLPLRRASIEQAIQLNGTAVTLNLAALALGRVAAAAPLRLEAPVPARPSDATGGSPLELRQQFLIEYQDAAYATRYRSLIDRVTAAEARVMPGHAELVDAVTRSYFKLMAYKDEYEVARLHSAPEFRADIARRFAGDYRLQFHLAPPGLTHTDTTRGVPRKITVGGWVLPVFSILARLRFLRGTRLDPFGWRAERRLERQLITDYEALVARLLAGLRPDRHALAVEIASLPEGIRGYGHVKARHLEGVRLREAELLRQWSAAEAPAGPGGGA